MLLNRKIKIEQLVESEGEGTAHQWKLWRVVRARATRLRGATVFTILNDGEIPADIRIVYDGKVYLAESPRAAAEDDHLEIYCRLAADSTD